MQLHGNCQQTVDQMANFIQVKFLCLNDISCLWPTAAVACCFEGLATVVAQLQLNVGLMQCALQSASLVLSYFSFFDTLPAMAACSASLSAQASSVRIWHARSFTEREENKLDRRGNALIRILGKIRRDGNLSPDCWITEICFWNDPLSNQ